MRKIMPMLLCLALLAGCRPAAVTPPSPPAVVAPEPGTTPVDGVPTPTHLVRAYVMIGDKEIELDEWPGYTGPLELLRNRVAAVEAKVVLEFSAPIDPDSLAEGNFKLHNTEGTLLISPLEIHESVVTMPPVLRDHRGELVFLRERTFALERTAYSIIYAGFADNPTVEIKSWTGHTLSPGESVRIEFAGTVDQDFVIRALGENPAITLHWESDNVLLLSVETIVTDFVRVEPEEWPEISWSFFVVPRQKLVVLKSEGEVELSVDLPLSAMGPIGMTDSFSRVRLARVAMYNPMHYGSSEYVFDIGTGRVDFPETLYSAYGLSAYATLDIGQAAYTAAMDMQLDAELVGVSHSRERVSSYHIPGEVVITTASTGEKLRIPVPSRIYDPAGYRRFEPMYWAPSDSMILYSGFSDIGECGSYILDLTTGEETLLAANHHLLNSSHLSEHLFTIKYSEMGTNYPEFYLVDYTGKQTRLNESGGRVVLTMWLDENRALVNKSPSNVYGIFFPDSQCFIYHLYENRWEFIAEGYGFDYDANTGRVFLLQER